MAEPHNSALVLAAVTTEVAPLVDRLGARADGPGAWVADRCTITTHGMGPGSAERIDWALDRYRPGRVLSTGLAGGLDPALAVGTVRRFVAVIDAASGARFESGGLHGLLITVDDPASKPAQKADLFQRFGAEAVDMESARVARLCADRGVGFTCLRAVSDTADQALPPGLGPLVDPIGRPRKAAAAVYALTRPHRVGALAALGRRSAQAARSLVDPICAWIDSPEGDDA